VQDHIFTVDGRPPHFPSASDHFPDLQTNVVPINVDAQKAELAGAPPQFVPDMPALACFRILRLHLRFGEARSGFPEALDPALLLNERW
jgi:hypothetical protein